MKPMNVAFRYYRMRDLPEIVGLCKAQIYVLIKQGLFPPGVKLGGGRSVGFRSDMVQAWLESQSFTDSRNGGIAA